MVHVHALIYGEYVPQATLQNVWTDVLGTRAIVRVQAVRGHSIPKTIRYVLKYASKGEGGAFRDPAYSAAIEIALRNVRRVELGGAIRNVRIPETDGSGDDVSTPEISTFRSVCEACGLVGRWRWEGRLTPDMVRELGGFGQRAAETSTGELHPGSWKRAPDRLATPDPEGAYRQ